MPIDGGGSRLVSDSVMTHGMDWSEDGYIYLLAPDLVLARVPESGGPIERLTTLDSAAGEVLHAFPRALPGGRGVLFTVGHRRYWDIDSAYVAVLDLRSGSRKTLFPGSRPTYSSSGHLVFGTGDGTLRAVSFDLKTLTPSGSPVVVASQVSVTGPSPDYDLSPNGDLVYLTPEPSGLRDHLVWVSRSGEVLSRDSTWPGMVRGMGLSPDGSMLAVSTGTRSNIWLKELPAGQVWRLTGDAAIASGYNVLDATPRWSPDGASIIFASPRPPARLDWDLYVQRIDARSDSLLVDGTAAIYDYLWAPDGTRLVWVESHLGSGDILTRALQQDAPTIPLAVTRFDERSPAIAADGRWLAYVSDETGRDEVFIRFADPAVGGRWQASDAGGRLPRWSRTGHELFYVDTTETLVALSVVGTPAPRVVRRRALFSVTGYRLSAGFEVVPGNEQFVFVNRPFADEREMVLVLNFAEELRRRVQPGKE